MSNGPFAAVVRDDASAPFFDAANDGRLALRRCSDCGHVRGPEVPMCTECLSEMFEWFTSVGTGHVESWVVLHSRAGADGMVPEPRVVATIELAEGPWMVSALLGIEPSAITGDMAVRVAFERPAGSEAIPVFRPATATSETTPENVATPANEATPTNATGPSTPATPA